MRNAPTRGHRLTDQALTRLIARLRLPSAALDMVQRIRSLPPSRRTEGRVSVRGTYPSEKMGLTIQFESHRCELPAILQFEYRPDVYEYYDQPPAFKLTYLTREGKRTSFLHTPDFFVIGDRITWVECKLRKDLQALSETMPNRYVLDDSGKWRCPPGEEYAAKFGMGYDVFVADEQEHELTRNLTYLEDYFRKDYPRPSDKLIKRVIAAVKDNQGISRPELLAKVPDLSVDDFNYLIARGTIHTDLRKVLLVDPDSVTLFSDALIASSMAAAKSTYATPVNTSIPIALELTTKLKLNDEVVQIINITDQIVQLLGSDGRIITQARADFEIQIQNGNAQGITPPDFREKRILQLISHASPASLNSALVKWHAIQPYVQSGTARHNKKRRKRSIRRWIQQFQFSEQAIGNGFVGLLPKPRPGHPNSHLTPEVDALINECIRNDYETLNSPLKSHVYRKLCLICEKSGLDAPSYRTFSKRLRERDVYQQTKRRKGHRAAYQHEKFYFYLDQNTPVHGDRPWEIGHIDHTELDIELVCSRTGRNLGRPWLSILMDARTRSILAIWVSFNSERSESSMMLLRRCVQRHHRLPQILVVDNGKSFDSIYFNSLLANFGITKKSRPPAKSRFGSVCERLFGTTNTQFILNLRGNTTLTKNVRQVTKAFAPQDLAVWTLELLTERLEEYCYEVYDGSVHSSFGHSPREEMRACQAESGIRPHCQIAYDRTFQILTSPLGKRGKVKIHPQKGIHLNHLDYWADEFKLPKLSGTEVPVRFEPWDASVAYAFVGNHWVTCISRLANEFKGRSHREIELATELYKAKAKIGQNEKVSNRCLADFMLKVERDESLLIQRLKDLACLNLVSTEGAKSDSTTIDRDPPPIPPRQSSTPDPLYPDTLKAEAPKVIFDDLND